VLLRLPHVLVLCALILASGVVSVRIWHAGVGGALEPGLVVVDDPLLTAPEAAALAERLGGRVAWVATDGRLLDPFDGELVAARTRRGELTTLFALDPATPRAGWSVLLDRTRDPVPLLRGERLLDHVVEEARRAVRAQRSLSAFVIGLTLGRSRELPGNRRRDPADVLAPLVEDLRALPEFRRTSLVVLGPPEPDERGWRRRAVRVDVGPWPDVDRPAVTDLLAPSR